MELLLSLLGEFSVTLLLPFALSLAVPFLASAGGLAGIFSAVRSVLWARRTAWILGASGVLGLVALLLADTVFYEPLLRRTLAKVRAASGVAVEFESARGNWMTGSASLRGVTLRREDVARSAFDLRAREVEIDVALTSLWSGTARVQDLRIAGLTGSYRRSAVPQDRRDFLVDRLVLEDAALLLSEPPESSREVSLPLRLERLEARSFRRSYAVFDLLFRSEAKGSIEGAPFEIRTALSPSGRASSWRATGLPAKFLADYVGEPFDWLREGRVDVAMDVAWNDLRGVDLETKWSVVLHDIAPEVPPRLTGLRRTIAEAAIPFLTVRAKRVPFEFVLPVNERHFEGSASIESSRLWEAAAEALGNELARQAGVGKETIADWARKGLEKFRRLIDRR
jgi:hypothetical protein